MPRQLKSAAATPPPVAGSSSTAEVVAGVIAGVRERGDVAVREYSEKFDNGSPPSFRLDAELIEQIIAGVPRQVIDDIMTVQANVRTFAQHQRDSLYDF